MLKTSKEGAISYRDPIDFLCPVAENPNVRFWLKDSVFSDSSGNKVKLGELFEAYKKLRDAFPETRKTLTFGDSNIHLNSKTLNQELWETAGSTPINSPIPQQLNNVVDLIYRIDESLKGSTHKTVPLDFVTSIPEEQILDFFGLMLKSFSIIREPGQLAILPINEPRRRVVTPTIYFKLDGVITGYQGNTPIALVSLSDFIDNYWEKFLRLLPKPSKSEDMGQEESAEILVGDVDAQPLKKKLEDYLGTTTQDGAFLAYLAVVDDPAKGMMTIIKAASGVSIRPSAMVNSSSLCLFSALKTGDFVLTTEGGMFGSNYLVSKFYSKF